MTLLDTRPASTAVTWSRARELAHGAAAPVGPVRLSLPDAAGLTLAEPLVARTPLPAFDTAAMDGYALAGLGPHRLTGRVAAGDPIPAPMAAGTAVEISTGAPVPAGVDVVLPLEHAVVADGLVLGPALPRGRHIRRIGEDAAAGQPLAPAGASAGPALLGLAAACGHDDLLVRPRPEVRVLVTGDELADRGRSGAGVVRDALGPALPGLVDRLGGRVAGLAHVSDAPGAFAAALPAGGVTVVTGSTSVGRTDRVRRFLRGEDARLVVDTVHCRPGHPMLLAVRPSGGLLVALPGNPFAALVGAHTLLGPLLAGLAGRPPARLPRLPVTGRASGSPDRTRIVPVRWAGGAAEVLAGHRSAALQGAALADALAALPPGWVDGDPAPLLLL